MAVDIRELEGRFSRHRIRLDGNPDSGEYGAAIGISNQHDTPGGVDEFVVPGRERDPVHDKVEWDSGDRSRSIRFGVDGFAKRVMARESTPNVLVVRFIVSS